MRRRKLLIALGGGLTLAWPHFSRAQRPTMPIIGFLYSRSRTGVAIPGAPFRQALAEAGYAEGRNLIFEYRSAEGNYDRLPDLAADLVQQPAAIIVALDLVCSRAAKAATSTIPIVFWSGGDPVHDGLVASLNRPGRNLTGVSMFNNVLGAKRLELLRELIPKATVFAILVNPANPNAEPQAKDAQEAARSKGVQLHVVRASTASDIEGAFDKLVNLRAEGLIVSADSYLASMKDRLVALAARHSIPTIYTIPSMPRRAGSSATPAAHLWIMS